MIQKTDAQLINEFTDGSQTALRELFERYIPSVFRFVSRLAPREVDVDDVVQDAFVKAWSQLKKYDHSRPFKTWIFTIAKNTLFDVLKKKRSVTFTELEFATEQQALDIDILEDEAPLPDELLARAEADERVSKMLLLLPPIQRTAVVLHVIEGLTFKEIGEVLGEPMDTVKSRYRRGIGVLNKMLKMSDRDLG